MKLYTSGGDAPSPQNNLVRLVAKLAGVQALQSIPVGPEDAQLQKKSLTGRFPVLEDGTTDQSSPVLVCGALPIARYLARENAMFCDGASLQQKSEIDAWIDYIQVNVVPAASSVLNQVNGTQQTDQKTFSISLNALKQTLTALDAHLALRNFLVGHQMSLADALLVSTMGVCFSLVVDKKTRDSSLQNLARYTSIILRMAPCVRVFGQVTFCKDTTTPDFNAEKPKKEQTPQQQQKQAKKGEAASKQQQKKPAAEAKQAPAAPTEMVAQAAAATEEVKEAKIIKM